MTEIADWTASAVDEPRRRPGNWVKFAVAGALILAALALFLYSTIRSNAQYFLTVQELRDRATEMVGKDVRVSGVVVPESISYNAATLHLEFDIVDRDSPSADPVRVVVDGQPLPDQMNYEAEAIVEGQLQPDGTFRAGTLMMKCASKYEEE